MFDLGTASQFFDTAGRNFNWLSPIQPDDVGEELDLLGREVAVGAVDLPEDVAGVDEQHLVLARRLRLALSKNQSVQGSVTV